jgi:hypothetical protein
VGKKLQISMEFLIIEVGLWIQIFQLDYEKYHSLATNCWLKLVWEKISHFGLHLTLRNVNCHPPRGGADWIMMQFLRLGYPENELSRLNRVRLHQQVLFVSDAMDAGGRAIDRKYMSRRLDTQSWSSLIFPKERPSRSDFKLWKAGLLQLRLGSRHSQTRIQGFQGGGHKVWDWRYDEEGGRVLHLKGNGVMDVYTPSLVPGFETLPNCWTRSRTEVRVEDCRMVCMVKEINLTVWLICSYAMAAPTPRTPTDFWEVMQEWGCDWLWKDLQLVSPTEWLADAIAEGSCIGVTDGSYM